MNYTELGYDKYLTKAQYSPSADQLTEDESSQATPIISGNSIVGGVVKSPDGRMEIDYNTGTILISDGAFPRVLIGYQENGF